MVAYQRHGHITLAITIKIAVRVREHVQVLACFALAPELVSVVTALCVHRSSEFVPGIRSCGARNDDYITLVVTIKIMISDPDTTVK